MVLIFFGFRNILVDPVMSVRLSLCFYLRNKTILDRDDLSYRFDIDIDHNRFINKETTNISHSNCQSTH